MITIDTTIYLLIHVAIGCYGLYIAWNTACSVPYIEDDLAETELDPVRMQYQTLFTVAFILYLSIDHIVQHVSGLI